MQRIYHSQDPSFGTYVAIKTMPNRKHIVTFRDPRDAQDWKILFQFPSLGKLQVLFNYLYEDSFLVKRVVRRTDGVFCTANCLIPKAKFKYGLKSAPHFLPTPVFVPNKIQKAITPTVCFLARLDRIKRPEIFFELTRKFPHVKFVAVGKAQDRKWDSYLRKTYSNLPNLEMTGFIDQFSSDLHSQILEKSWVLVNTSAKEALPNSFVEAGAYRCAILSTVDPDGFASQFGYHAKDDDFAKGLDFLLENQRWKERGELGYEYVKETFEINRAIDQHVAVYEQILAK